MMDWISVKDKLPKESGRYFVHVSEVNDLGVSHYAWNAYYDLCEKEWRSDLRHISVKHWMHIPELPKDGE